jgi:2-oxo-3-hexenedioate decarboxylase
MNDAEIADWAGRILASKQLMPPLTDTLSGYELGDAYRLATAIRNRRIEKGEKPVGWKIGFTNSAIWAQQGLDAPIWAAMYDDTVAAIGAGGASASLRGLLQPRIEPEIGLRLSSVPDPEMDEAELIGCIDAVTHGFEVVQSIYPDWKLKPADAVSAFGMHGFYRHGPLVPITASDRQRWLRQLREFTVVLLRDGVEVERGVGTNVLGGPLASLRHMVHASRRYPGQTPLRSGDLVSTGTLTPALPVKPGERWTTSIEGIPLSGLDLALTA